MTPSRVFRFARKELRETLRDRRTVLTLVLMPVLLYPLLGVVFRQFFLVGLGESAPEYRIGVGSEREGEVLMLLLSTGERSPPPRRPAVGVGVPPPGVPTVIPFVATDLLQSVRDGGVHLGIRIPDLPSRNVPLADVRLNAEALLLDDSLTGREALDYLRGRIAAANVRILKERLRPPGGREVASPVTLEARAVTNPDRTGAFSLSTLVPLVLILMTITGAVYPAIDLTAGERERGTLEVLMAAPVPKVGLLAAKYLAVVAVSTLTGLVNLGMMALTLWLSGLAATLFGPKGLTIATVFSVLGLLVLFAAFFSALLLALTSFARSFKEAQAYLIPLMLVALTPGLLALAPGLRLTGGKTVIPLLNVVLLARDVFDGTATAGAAAAVVASTLLYAAAAVALAARVFGAEAVLYGDGGQWSDLVRRPQQPRPVATASGALLTLALLFPLQFVLHGALLSHVGASPATGVVMSAVVGVVLFVGVSLLSALLGRVRVPTGFALAGAPWAAFPAGLALGLAFVPVSAEIANLERAVGFSSIPDVVRDRLDATSVDVTLAILLFAFAVVPALVEEFFFRGYLFTALATASSNRTAVLATAALFGLFHIVTGELLVVERFLPTFVFGLALGWARGRSGSIWPSVVAHAVHNAAGLVAVREGLFKGTVPTMWLAAAVALGVVAVWVFARSGVRPAIASPATSSPFLPPR